MNSPKLPTLAKAVPLRKHDRGARGTWAVAFYDGQAITLYTAQRIKGWSGGTYYVVERNGTVDRSIGNQGVCETLADVRAEIAYARGLEAAQRLI